jgi:hypothetical protein
MQNNVGIYASQISGHLYGGPYGAYDALATVTVPSGGVSSISFAGIPSGYKHLQLRAIIKTISSGGTQCRIRVGNGSADTGNNYSRHGLAGDGASSSAYGVASDNLGSFSDVNNVQFGPAVCDILDYTSANKNKTIRVLSGVDTNGAGIVGLFSTAWMNSTTAINYISLFPVSDTFAQYSQFALYGIK